MNMRDTWDCLSREIEFSFIRSNCKSRLDRIYVSANLVEQLRSASFHVNCFSDHKVYRIRLCLPDLGRAAGNGYWAMRAHVLTEENVEVFENKWNYWCRQRRNYNSWIEWWIDYAKPRIKGFFKKKTNDSFREFHAKNEFLYARLKTAYEELYQHPNKMSEVNRLKGKMLLLQREFSKKFVRINDQ